MFTYFAYTVGMELQGDRSDAWHYGKCSEAAIFAFKEEIAKMVERKRMI